ncbi:type I restriction-modification system subunit M [Patescibacteria group bacterium]|nr:type I restriction-modification system subunit M [Patescibacteria group bacterium]MBU4016038.1 type I restriction-modification system subunit M [Patescibacteria group bacterium]MBU4099193.1 type I restriction-modification system subunit M [Patescibacteria group bacterium]
MLSNTIKSEINNLWDKFWSGGIANPLTAIEQISYLLFMKRIDELDLKRKADAETGFSKQKYISIFGGTDKDGEDNQKKRWSYFKQLEGGEMLTHVQAKVFPFIKTLKNGNSAFTEHMKDAVFMIPKASLLVEAVNIIDNIYNEIEREQKEGQSFQDTQGDVYEYLLSEIAQSGKNGQFRTPRHIIQMIAALVDPKLGEEICDPACGTGGFLLGAYQHILTQHTSENYLVKEDNGTVWGTISDKLSDKRQWQFLREKAFYGFDFDTTMVRIGLMNLMLHGIDHPNIDYKDTLSKKYNENNRFDVVMANPPFKGSIDKSDINEDLSINTTKTELLFVNRIYNMLRLGGRAGVIVPDGVLFGSSNAHKALRKLLIEQCELQGVISMPSGVFKPYAGVSTAVLIFVKGGTTENVWFYDMEADGYSLDDKRTKTVDNDIPDIISKWKSRNPQIDIDKKQKAFFVNRKEIEENNYDLSINRYKDADYKEVEYEDPAKILEKIENLENEISNGLFNLRNQYK